MYNYPDHVALPKLDRANHRDFIRLSMRKAMPVNLLALDMDRVSKLTGIPKSTLASWEKTGVYTPSYISERERTPFRRIYSFRDAVSLRALAKIRREHKVSLSEIRRAGEYLSQHYESPWSELRFGVVDHRLVFRDPETKEWTGVSGQAVMELNMEGIPQEIEQGLPKVMGRERNQVGHVTQNRYVRHNQPVIAGTRIPTSTIWAFHEEGYSPEEIIDEYPHLTPEDIHAAIRYEQDRRLSA